MVYIRDILALTNGELCVLRWLRINSGKATMSANALTGSGLFVVPDRLLKARYVETQVDRSSPKTMHYALTAGGREALELNECRAFFADSAKRRRPFASTTHPPCRPVPEVKDGRQRSRL